MKGIFYILPNFITCLNLTSGFIAIILSFDGNYAGASIAICLAAVFDFIDGFTARLLKVYSAIGGQLDSLSDLVSFGVAPAVMVYNHLSYPYGWIAILIPVFGALRLARFNVDTEQKDSFIGLPIPGNAIFWIGTIYYWSECTSNFSVLWLKMLIVTIISLLMVLPIRLPSLKFHNSKFIGDNIIRYIIIIVSVILFLIFKIPGLSLIIIIYILIGMILSLKLRIH